MSLLHPTRHHEITPEAQLDDITPSNAITMLRAVENYGPDVSRGLYRDDTTVQQSFNDAVQTARQVERTAIEAALPLPSFSEEEMALAVKHAKVDRANLTQREDVMVDHYDAHNILKYGFEAKRNQLEFMARCLLKGVQVRSDESSEEYNIVLDWMRENPRTKSIVESLESKKIDRVSHLGKKAVQFILHSTHPRASAAH